jgi:hypothetical protein
MTGQGQFPVDVHATRIGNGGWVIDVYHADTNQPLEVASRVAHGMTTGKTAPWPTLDAALTHVQRRYGQRLATFTHDPEETR